ncbi:MAG: lipid A biosynthesis acyltransferase [Gammaproteobacteria bacterium]|nr:lipid A biosynthesis acyltransferase [Gammaproteobacteria bacterium]MCK5262927.1 lipid A biosynthesis acyltransferase [Gammaproteobacteria bacterium]
MSAAHSIQSNIPAFGLSLLRPRYWLTWLGLIFLFILAWLPQFVTSFLSRVLGVYGAAKNKKRYHIARVNLKLCYPNKDEKEIDAMLQAHFIEQVRAMLYYARLWFYPEFMLRRMILVEGFEQIEQCLKQDRNIIILLSHSVGLDVAIASISMRYGANGPYKSMRNPVFDWLLANRRVRYGGTIFPREDGLRPIIRATRTGDPLVYLADEDLGSDRSIFVPLFGVQKATIPVLGRLTKSCKATVLPCICCYDRQLKKYKTTLLPPVENMTGDDMGDALAMNQAIEKTIAVCPSQYFWSFRLFQTRPPGEKSLYE